MLSTSGLCQVHFLCLVSGKSWLKGKFALPNLKNGICFVPVTQNLVQLELLSPTYPLISTGLFPLLALIWLNSSIDKCVSWVIWTKWWGSLARMHKWVCLLHLPRGCWRQFTFSAWLLFPMWTFFKCVVWTSTKDFKAWFGRWSWNRSVLEQSWPCKQSSVPFGRSATSISETNFHYDSQICQHICL